jgi:RNA polymerase sigma factor (sigma-70 family)
LETEITFENLFNRYKDKMYRICRIMVYNKTHVDDLFQEVSMKIFKSLDKFEGNSKIETWIFRIIMNSSINFNLKEQRYQDKNQLFVNQISEDTKSENDLNEELLLAISKLNTTERAVMGLFLEGYSYKEIAEILGLTKSNVGVKINRIKEKLKVILTKA